MKIVHGGETAIVDRPGRGRTGKHKGRTILNSEILDRDRNRPDNVAFRINYYDGSFKSPRHHHNFAQWRFWLEGEGDWGYGKVPPGTLGFFPEGAYYGPESGATGCMVQCQFGGPSGWGLFSDRITDAQRDEAYFEMAKFGVFGNGKFTQKLPDGAERVQDATEAIWEYVHQRTIEYPKPQYDLPLFIDTLNYPWVPMERLPGVSQKYFGTFTHCKMPAACYDLEPGAKLLATGRGIYLVLDGAGSVDGAAYERFTTLYLEDDERGTFQASEKTEILLLGLPSIKLMMKQDLGAIRQFAAA
jgi:hypothetical protein